MTGYQSKRAAARDKMVDDRRAYYEKFDDLYAVYLNGVYDGKKAAQTTQEPVAYLCKPDQHGLFDRPTPDKACEDCFPVYAAPPQPAQEPPQYSFKAYWAEDGRIGVVGCIIRPDGNPHILEEFIDPPQPAQEPWRESASDYERGVIDGRQMQAQSSVDKAVNAMTQRPWVDLTDEQVRSIAKPLDDTEIPMTGRMWIFVGDLMDKLKEQNT
jgi:hypothetical protein